MCAGVSGSVVYAHPLTPVPAIAGHVINGRMYTRYPCTDTAQGYEFAGVGVRVALENPRVTRDDPYILLNLLLLLAVSVCTF
jgi:hypothetical protein